MKAVHSFEPVVGDGPRVLILGTMPSVESLARREYYANPRNHFWRLIAAVLDMELPQSYKEKIAMVEANGIALWDSVEKCTRSGSLDKDIKDVTSNDIDSFLDKHPTIEAVCFNGAKSRDIFLRHFKTREGIRYILLPSSSPIPRKNIRTFEDKLRAWLALRELLGE